MSEHRDGKATTKSQASRAARLAMLAAMAAIARVVPNAARSSDRPFFTLRGAPRHVGARLLSADTDYATDGLGNSVNSKRAFKRSTGLRGRQWKLFKKRLRTL